MRWYEYQHVFTIKFSNLAGEEFEADFEETREGWGRHARSWPNRIDHSEWIAQKDDIEGVIARHVSKRSPGRGVPCGCVTLFKTSSERREEHFCVHFHKVSKDDNKNIIRFAAQGTFNYVVSLDAVASLTEETINGFKVAPRSFWDNLNTLLNENPRSEKLVGSVAWQVKDPDTWMEIILVTAVGGCPKSRKDLKKCLPPALFTKEFVAQAFRRNVLLKICWFFADGDREAVLYAASLCGEALNRIENRKWCRDRQIMMAAVSQDGRSLEYCSMCGQEDRDIVSAALAQNGRALQFAKKLQNDREIVGIAMQQDANAFRYASKELRADREFVLGAIAKNGSLLNFVEGTLRSDAKFVIDAMARNGLALQGALEKHKAQRNIVLAAVRQNGLALKYVGQKRRKDRNVALAAVLQDEHALEFISDSLKSDAQILQAVHGRTDTATEAQQNQPSSNLVGPAAKKARLSRDSSNPRTFLWTDTEVEALKRLHAEHGNKWNHICQQFDFRGKTPMQLKDKMRNLTVSM